MRPPRRVVFAEIVLLSAVALLHASSAPSQAAAAFAAGESATTIISQLQSSLTQVLRELEGVYSKSAFDTRTHVVALIQQLQLSSEALEGKTFGDLNNTQQQLFSNVQLVLNSWNSGNKHALDNVNNIVTNLNSVLATLPLANTWPRVTGYAPSFVVQGEGPSAVDIRIFGSWLGEGSPTLLFVGRSCDRTEKTESELGFRCAIPSIGNPRAFSAPRPLSGELTVAYRHAGIWDSLKAMLGFEKTRNYDIGLSGIPPELGTYGGNASVVQSVPQVQPRSESCSHHNDHCQGPYTLTCNETATQGWEIDQNSVNAQVGSKSDDSHFDGVYDKTTNGFQLRATVVNSGSCGPKVPFTDQHVPDDGRGQVTLGVTWLERRTASTSTTVPIQGGALLWGTQAVVSLPVGSSSVTVTVKRADGRSDIVTGTGHYGWIDAEFRPDSRTLVLRPLAPGDALSE